MASDVKPKMARKKRKRGFDFNEALNRVTQDPQSNFAQILFAAEELFAVHGFKGVGIRDIAEAVGTNVSTLHFHWYNKETLYEGVCRYQAALIANTLSIPPGAKKPNSEELKESLRALITLFTANPSIAPVALQSVSGQGVPELPAVAKHDATLFDGLSSLLKRVSTADSLGSRQPKLAFLSMYYALLLLFNDSVTQQAFIGAPVLRDKRLQSKITDFAENLFELLTADQAPAEAANSRTPTKKKNNL